MKTIGHNQVTFEFWGQFYQPAGVKRKYAGNQYFVPAVSFWRHSVLPTKLRSTLSEHTTGSYAQLLPCMLCAIRQ